MAFADVVKPYHTFTPSVGLRVEDTAALYTDQTGASNGEWIDMAGVISVNYVVNGITTGTVLFRGWNGATKQAATEHGEAIYGTATSDGTLVTQLTADGTISFAEHQIYRYMKVYPSVVTSISLDVDMKRVRLAG